MHTVQVKNVNNGVHHCWQSLLSGVNKFKVVIQRRTYFVIDKYVTNGSESCLYRQFIKESLEFYEVLHIHLTLHQDTALIIILKVDR